MKFQKNLGLIYKKYKVLQKLQTKRKIVKHLKKILLRKRKRYGRYSRFKKYKKYLIGLVKYFKVL